MALMNFAGCIATPPTSSKEPNQALPIDTNQPGGEQGSPSRLVTIEEELSRDVE